MNASIAMCDNTAAAVLIYNPTGHLLLTSTARGWTVPTARHVLPAGGVLDPTATEWVGGRFLFGARCAVRECAGMQLTLDVDLRMVVDQWCDDACTLPVPDRLGTGHHWRVYRAEVGAPDGVSGVEHLWASAEQAERMAHRTARYVAGLVPEMEWRADPGLLPVWVWWLHRLGLLPYISGLDASACVQFAARAPHP